MIILLLLLTMLLWGSTPIIEKIGIAKTDPVVALSIRSIAVISALIIFLLGSGRLRDIFSQEPKTWIIFSASGIMAGLLGMLTYFAALKMGEASKVVPIAAAYPLVAAVLGIVILREPLSIARLIGTLLIISGIWLVK